jgi:hypothetical protein
MLADLTLVGCYNASAVSSARRRATMIANAKTNLRRLAFFGLTERQVDSGYLFERRFGVRFRRDHRHRRPIRYDELVDSMDANRIFDQFNSTRAHKPNATRCCRRMHERIETELN